MERSGIKVSTFVIEKVRKFLLVRHFHCCLIVLYVISCTGEANQGNYEDYDCAIQQMVADWRGKWYDHSGQTMDPQFPFGQVQVMCSLAIYLYSIKYIFDKAIDELQRKNQTSKMADDSHFAKICLYTP